MVRSLLASQPSGSTFDITTKSKELSEAEQALADPSIWKSGTPPDNLIKTIKRLKPTVDAYQLCENDIAELETFAELANEPDLAAEGEELASSIEKRLDALELASYFDGPYDQGDCYIQLKAGQGGQEAQAWTDMLTRMYLKFCELQGFKASLDAASYTPAGIRDAEISVSGHCAYGMLKHEAGVHRLQRISPFDPTGNRQTSFTAVEVVPDVDTSIELEIDWDKDVKKEFYCASGPGGQHRNRNATAVRLTHLVTGITANCAMKSQPQNLKSAQKVLAARLLARLQKEQKARLDELRGNVAEASWGNHSRTYVLDAKRVHDHRTNYKEFDPFKVLDGHLHNFVESLVKQPRV